MGLTVLSQGHNNTKEANKMKAQLIEMAFCGALSAVYVGKFAWMCNQSQRCWDCDVMCFIDTDFFHKFIIMILRCYVLIYPTKLFLV